MRHRTPMGVYLFFGIVALGIILFALLIYLLTRPAPPPAPRWQERCVESHTELRLMPTTAVDFEGRVTVVNTLQPVTVCDRREIVCVTYGEGQQCPALDMTEG